MSEAFEQVCTYKPKNNTRWNRYWWGYIVPRKESGGVKTPLTYATKWTTEFLGTALFTILGGASGNALLTKTVGGTTQFMPGAGLNGAFNNAIALATCIYISAAFSGGKLNPAVSLALAVGAAQTLWESAMEMAVQIVGGIVGANVVHNMMLEPKDMCFGAGEGVSGNKVLAWETLITFVLCMTVFATAVEGTSVKFQPTAPLAIGLSLFAGAQAAGTYTGAAANPARFIGPLAVSGLGCKKKDAGMYLLGQFMGGLFAGLVYIVRFLISQWYCESVEELDDEKDMYNNGRFWKLIGKGREYNEKLIEKESTKWNDAHEGEYKSRIPRGAGQSATVVPMANATAVAAPAYRTGFMATDL